MIFQKDSRITVNSMSFRNYFVLFLMILSVCGGYAGIYFGQRNPENPADEVHVILSILTYIVIVSFLLLGIFFLFRQYSVIIPVRRISEAARKVTQGDFSVRIPPQRRDGKKDEFEVLYDDFNAMVAELASTEMLKKDFVSNVSHELKTPLSVIQSYASILQANGLSDAERQEYAERIMVATEKLSVLVTNILQISRLENQKIQVASAPFNLSEQLCQCIAGFEAAWETKEILLETDFDRNIVIKSDHSLLDIVWNNLISNALKFTPHGGCVTISVKQETGWAKVTVSDTGCGIKQEQIPHIFEKFYQADASHSAEGNGLGLVMVKEIVAITGGNISVKSEAGAGSAFCVLLPL